MSSLSSTYEPCGLKRLRRTKAEMARFHSALRRIVRGNQPCSVRQVYYLAVSGGLIGKDTGGSRSNYQKVIRALGDMRESGEMPWRWISDNTRWRSGPELHADMKAALERTALFYRRDLWRTQRDHVEVWVESDSIASVIHKTTEKLGVDVLPCRGQSSKDFAWSAAQEYKAINKSVRVFYIGDWDPSGLAISSSLRERLARYGPAIPPVFERLAIVPDQVPGLGESAHASNRRDPNFQRFVEACQSLGLDPDLAIEVEAFPPPDLRALVEAKIVALINQRDWQAEMDVEDAERNSLDQIIDGLPGAASVGGPS